MSFTNYVSIKIILLGDICSGKTSFCNRFKKNEYDNTYISTIGVDYHTHYLYVSEGNYKLQIWDVAGQDRFNYIISGFFRGINIIIIMIDLHDVNSINSIEKWINMVNMYCVKPFNIILVGNKNDLPININKEIIFNLYKNLSYIEISVKNDLNFDTLFNEIILNYTKLNILNSDIINIDNIDNNNIDNNNYKFNKCCIII
jgi:small GTP-binding protein